ncbi:MAG TPA: hypothetical protein VGM25_06580 [Caulobacteraceae bacterium]|jgi:hypothetical protein
MNLALKPQEAAIDRSVAEVLEAVSRETSALHHLAMALQTMAGDLIERARLEPQDPLMEEAQALDALAQKLDALTGFLDRVARSAPPSWRLDIAHAIEPVFLADLAKRLCRELSPEDDVLAQSGDFELF